MNRRDRTAVVFLRGCLSYLLLESLWVKIRAGVSTDRFLELLNHWLSLGVEEAWISKLLILGEAYPERALGIILGIEGGAGALLALGLWTRFASLLAGLLYGLRYAIAPDGLALWVALVAAAVCVSDSGKSLRLFSLRQRRGENAPQTNSL